MPYSVEGKLVVAISSRALLDFEDENRVFERDGEGAYIALQLARLDVPAREGVAFALVKKLADSIANAQIAENLEPIGLAGYHGLQNVRRFGDAHADRLRQPADFYSPDTFNYNVLDVSADGKTLTVTSYGINSTVQNGFVEYDPVNNPERELFRFQIKRHP